MARIFALVLILIALPGGATGGTHHGTPDAPVCETAGPAHQDGPTLVEATDCEGCEGLACHVMPGCTPVTAVTSADVGSVRLIAGALRAPTFEPAGRADETIPDLSAPPPRT